MSQETVALEAQAGDPLWLRAAQKLGPATLIALGLTYFLTQIVSGDLQEIKAAQAVQATESAKQAEKQLLLLRAICLGLNKDEPSRSMCEVGR